MSELPIAPMARIMKNAGAQRISDSAGRKTVTAADIKLALK